MEIRELDMKSYGKFSDHHMTFRSGINIIYGGNETGKTTIHSFIKAMLFGMSRARGRAAKMDEYQVRQPWDAPGAFLGSMRFAQGDEVYRIDRCFDRSAKPLGLVCETKNLESAHPQEDLDALLGGISETAFINSVFIGQAQCETDEGLSRELRRYMINSESSMDSEIDVTGVLQQLRRKKKQMEQQQKKEEEELEARIAGKQERADQIRGELEFLRRQMEAPSQGYDQSRIEAENSMEAPPHFVRRQDAPSIERNALHLDDVDDVRKNQAPSWMHILLCVMLVVAGTLTLAGIFLTGETTLRIFLGVFTFLFWGMALGVHFLFHTPASKNNLENAMDAQNEAPAASERLMQELRERENEYEKLQDDLEVLYQQHVRIDGAMEAPPRFTRGQDAPALGRNASHLDGAMEAPPHTNDLSVTNTETEIAALTMAIDRICEISDRIYRENGGRLNEIASEILEEITEGRYSRIVIDDTAQVRIHTPSRVLGLNQVSGGTMQQIYFALRMAAGELLGEGVSLPIILDETFAMYDDRRLEATLSWLKKSGRQVILFTCQNREREILKRIS
ncbi:MAG: AAA family ATPase [Lachnospiraceae bacterium]|nr:AAA family ATPase [Lachnospiraceae bacterium]